jgi:hypothetical protein
MKKLDFLVGQWKGERFAGCMTGLPPDMAEQHDHYIHGTS